MRFPRDPLKVQKMYLPYSLKAHFLLIIYIMNETVSTTKYYMGNNNIVKPDHTSFNLINKCSLWEERFVQYLYKSNL